MNESSAVSAMRGSTGATLRELSFQQPTLAVFLRHAGCPFCRETLARLREARPSLEEAGVRPALVHMMPEPQAAEFIARYGLADLPRFSDPERRLYRELGMGRGGLRQVMGPSVWWRGFLTTVLGGHRPGMPQGDVRQLGGAALLHDGAVVAAQQSETSADAIDFEKFPSCPLPASNAFQDPAQPLP